MQAAAGLIILICLNALAFWQRHIFIYILISAVDIVAGLLQASTATLYSTTWIEGVVIAIIGIFCLYRAGAKTWGRE